MLMYKIFIIGAMTGTIALVGTAMFYWPPRRPRAVAHIPRRTLLKEMDYIGTDPLNARDSHRCLHTQDTSYTLVG